MVLTFDAKDDRDQAVEEMKPDICCARKRDAATHILDLSHPQLDNDTTQTIKESWQKARLVSD